MIFGVPPMNLTSVTPCGVSIASNKVWAHILYATSVPGTSPCSPLPIRFTPSYYRALSRSCVGAVAVSLVAECSPVNQDEGPAARGPGSTAYADPALGAPDGPSGRPAAIGETGRSAW